MKKKMMSFVYFLKEQSERFMAKRKMNIDLMIPADDVDLKGYEDLLDLAFRTPDVKNVAVTGIFGAGKSSILNTYQKKRPGKKILFISLANIKATEKKEKDYEDGTDVVLKDVENRICQQLRQYVRPTGRYGWREEGSIRKLLWKGVIGLLSFAFISCFIFVWKFDVWKSFYPDIEEKFPYLKMSTEESFRFVVGIIAAIDCFILWMLTVSKIKSVSVEIKGGTVVWEGKEKAQGLREQMSEIVRLVRRLKADAIVFEDLDRYPDVMPSVIESLIDINFMVNMNPFPSWERNIHYLCRRLKKWFEMWDIYIRIIIVITLILSGTGILLAARPKIECVCVVCLILIILTCRIYKRWKYHVLFIYACNNDLLNSEVNGKYFNMQIPVIPVLQSKNAEALLRSSLIGKLPLDKSEQLISSVSKYIENYNQVKDILMNFYVYDNRICEAREQRIWLDENKVLAIAVYKSFFPKDFSLMQKGKGYLDYLFRHVQGEEQYCELKNDGHFQLIDDLCRDNYIDHTYEDYLSYLYEWNTEKEFLEALTRNGKPYEFVLLSPEVVCRRAEAKDFDSPAILNYTLLQFLLDHEEEYILKLKRMVKMIIEKKKMDFVIGFMKDIRRTGEFLRLLTEEKPGFLLDLFNEIFHVHKSEGEQEKKKLDRLILDFEKYKNAMSGSEMYGKFIINVEKKLNETYFEDYADLVENGVKDQDSKELLAAFEKMGLRFDRLVIGEKFCWKSYGKHLYNFREATIESIYDKVFAEAVPWKCLTGSIYRNTAEGAEYLKAYVEKAPEAYLSFITEYIPGNVGSIEDDMEAYNWLKELMAQKEGKEYLLNTYEKLTEKPENRQPEDQEVVV